jgi:hypothetical protein
MISYDDDRTGIDKWLWAGALDSVTAERAGAQWAAM